MIGVFDPILSMLAFAVLASTLLMVRRVVGHLARLQENPSIGWLFGAAVAMGGGLWASHFIFLLAYHLPIPVGHNILMSIAALALSMVTLFLLLRFVPHKKTTWVTLLVFGVLAGTASLTSIRFSGFAAMQISPPIRYAPPYVLASIATYAFAALLLLYGLRRHYLDARTWPPRVGRARTIVLIAGLILMAAQYLAIHSLSLTPNAYSSAQSSQANEIWMAVSILDPELFLNMTEQVTSAWNSSMAAAVAACAFLLLGASLLVTLFDAKLSVRTARLAESRGNLRKALGELELIFKNASLGICTVLPNSEGRHLLGRTNHAMEDMLGYSPGELNGRDARILYPNRETYETIAKVYAGIAASGVIFEGEYTLQHHNGHQLLIALKGSAIDNSDFSKGSIWLLENIGERKRMERDLLLAKEQAEAAVRSKSEFLANMSHEIRTPMNAVIGLSRLMMNTSLDKRQLDYMNKVSSASKALLGILNDILDYSKIEAGHLALEAVDFALDDTLDSLANLFGAQVEGKEIELFFEIKPDVPRILHGDPLRLGQVLNNLVSNALKFTERGQIHLKIEKLGHDKDGLRLRFSVRDTGIGIQPEQLGRLFKPFSQADRSVTRKYGGTGLGLSISKHIVELMNGSIGVNSQPGVGSEFYFSICVAADRRAPAIHIGLSEMRVLVVDDQRISRLILRQMMEPWHFEVDEARSGEEALKILADTFAAGRPYDLILLDWQMPGIDGLQVARQIEQDCKDGVLQKAPVVIMVTALGLDRLNASLGETHLDAVLTKPVTVSHLFDTLVDLQRGTAAPSTAKEQPLLKHKAPPVLGSRVLLVEDNLVNQEIAREFLEEAGLLVETANNGREAVEMVQEKNYDIVLMDLHMPELDGLDATRQIRANGHAALPIVAMTAAVMKEDKDAAFAAGMNAHIGKPIDLDELMAVLSHWTAPAEHKKSETVLEIEPQQAPFDLNLPGFDLQMLIHRLGGNTKEVPKILRLFTQELNKVPEKLSHFLAMGDYEGALRLVHTVKGSSGNIGAKQLHTAAITLENELAKDEATSHQEFISAVQSALSAIDSLVFPVSHSTEQVTPNAQGAIRCLTEIDAYLATHEIMPEDLLPELRAVLPKEIPNALFETLQAQVDSFDYLSAQTTLLELLARLDVKATPTKPTG